MRQKLTNFPLQFFINELLKFSNGPLQPYAHFWVYIFDSRQYSTRTDRWIRDLVCGIAFRAKVLNAKEDTESQHKF